MHDPYEVLWGNAPGSGPARRDEIAQATEEANRAIPGLFSFFKFLLLAFVILYPIFVVWYFVSPRTFDTFMRGQPVGPQQLRRCEKIVEEPKQSHAKAQSRQGRKRKQRSSRSRIVAPWRLCVRLFIFSPPLSHHRHTPSRQGDHSHKARVPANRPTSSSPSN